MAQGYSKDGHSCCHGQDLHKLLCDMVSACAPCNDDDDDDDEIMMNSSCYYITATIITFISIFLSSLTMTVAISGSP